MRSDDKPQMSVSGRRRLALSLAGLAAVPAILLAACGNADHKVSQDTRPDARPSTVGVQPVFPSAVPTDPALNTLAPGIPPEDLVSQQGFGARQPG